MSLQEIFGPRLRNGYILPRIGRDRDHNVIPETPLSAEVNALCQEKLLSKKIYKHSLQAYHNTKDIIEDMLIGDLYTRENLNAVQLEELDQAARLTTTEQDFLFCITLLHEIEPTASCQPLAEINPTRIALEARNIVLSTGICSLEFANAVFEGILCIYSKVSDSSNGTNLKRIASMASFVMDNASLKSDQLNKLEENELNNLLAELKTSNEGCRMIMSRSFQAVSKRLNQLEEDQTINSFIDETDDLICSPRKRRLDAIKLLKSLGVALVLVVLCCISS